MSVNLRKFYPGMPVDFYGEDRGNVVGRPYVDNILPDATETIVDVIWHSTGRIEPEYLWALKPLQSA